MEAETKWMKIRTVVKNSYLSKKREPNGYTKRSFVSDIHIYINLSTCKPQSGDHVTTQFYNGTETSHV